ncbi:MAG: polysaccharide biosynthesis PFTS motif protein [Deltaproteobacteria bacterium]|nr:polysaccharide biosynthesis PFTS motif protein [Deltaproteobacteria bacterium]
MRITTKLILEAPSNKDRRFVLEQVNRGVPVYVIEPFYAYHHQGKIMFFPPPLVPFIESLLEKGRIQLISADSLYSREIYLLAAERAVEHVEKVYPFYLSQHRNLISAIIQQLDSEQAERIFKKRLCEQLAIFFSINLTFEKVRHVLGDGELIVHAPIDVNLYKSLEYMITQTGGIPIQTDNHIKFSTISRRRSSVTAFKKSASIFIKIVCQFFASLILSRQPKMSGRGFKYGIAVISPQRQFRGNNRGPDFLIDNHTIKKSEVAYFPLVPMQPEYLTALHKLGSDVIPLPAPGRFFSDGKQWRHLLACSLKELPFGYREVETAAANLFNYLRWKYILSKTKVQHFITHADFGDYHISRNIALNQHGAQTWYYTDASNFSLNFREDNGRWNLHPFWTYLYYDHFITWYEDLGKYFSMHPGTFKNIEVVGCLWSQHIENKNTSIYPSEFKIEKKLLNNKFKIVVFTSTYTVKGITSYDEAITFLQDIIRLANELEDVVIIVKEKKRQEFHLQLDPIKGTRLLEILNDMSQNPRLRVLTRDANTSLLIGESDLCISFPFTSTTIEALSVDHPAIWHDSQSFYRHNVYSEFKNIVTHGYDELKETVLMHMKSEGKTYRNPIPEGYPLMDPFRDGKAIERFRDLFHVS